MSHRLNSKLSSYTKVGDALIELKKGEKIGDILKKCTECSVEEVPCFYRLIIKITGVCPEKTEVMICPLGVTRIKDCPYRHL